MRNWNFIPEHPISLTLAADARVGETDYLNDQIWEVKFGNSDPPSISLETTFGLRARLCRIFPRFIYGDQTVNDPTKFAHPVTILHYFPNFIEFSFKPFSPINVNIEYWVPDSQTITGRIKITNSSHSEIPFQVEWSEILLPSPDGFRMSINEMGMTTILAGKTSDLFPVLFLTGGAQTGKSPYPSLNLTNLIPAHGEASARWVHASLADMNISYEHAKSLLSKNWDTEFVRLDRVNSRSLDIRTGNKDWDTAFLLSQNMAYQLILNPIKDCNSPSFVNIRRPDQGFSFRKDGTDYNYLWNGQTPLDTYYLSNFLIPSDTDLVKGFINNFIDSQNDQNEIDLKPGLCGQRSHILATPILSFLALRLYETIGDDEFLSAILPKLHSFFLSWFCQAHDRDADQIPEWDQIAQTGFDDSPLFTQTHPGLHVVEISTIESPALTSLLFRECNTLIEIAKIVKKNEIVGQLKKYLELLKSMVDQTWSDQYACYLYRDRDSHLTTNGRDLGTLEGSGILEVNKSFDLPVRPTIFLETKSEITHPCTIFIHGTSGANTHRVENIPANRIHWQHQSGYATSEYTYTAIEHIEINGNRPNDIAVVNTMDLSYLDQTLLLPIWAGIPTKQRAKILINLTVMNKKKFLGQFGLRSYVDISEPVEKHEDNFGNNLPWTALIMEGLIRYEGRNKAAEVFTRLMKSIIRSLQTDMVFHQSYHNESGKSLGVQNSLSSLVPINLFLDIAGIKIINPYHVEISGHNPFPWAVTVKYRGLTIIKQEKKTLIIFPDGYNITVTNDKLQVIERRKKI